MVKRAHDWNESLAQRLKNKDFARDFLISYLESGKALKTAFHSVIRAYGVKDLAARVKMPSSNLSRTLHHRSNPTFETFEGLLKPFGFELTVRTAVRRRAASFALR